MRRFAMMVAVLAVISASALLAQVTLGTGGAVTLGSGDRRPVDIIADGVPYLRIQPGGQITLLNGAAFGNNTIGTTTDVPFSASNFTLTGGTKTWTVQEADVIAHYYAGIGKMRWYSLDVVSTDISAAGTDGNVMNIVVPFVATRRAVVPAVISNNNVWSSDARCLMPAGGSLITCVLNSAAHFTAGTGTQGLRFQLQVEAQ